MSEAYENTLTARGGIRAYANVETMHQELPNFFPEYYLRRKESNVSIRAILPNNSFGKDRAAKDSEELRESRFIDSKKYSFSPELNVCFLEGENGNCG